MYFLQKAALPSSPEGLDTNEDYGAQIVHDVAANAHTYN